MTSASEVQNNYSRTQTKKNKQEKKQDFTLVIEENWYLDFAAVI